MKIKIKNPNVEPILIKPFDLKLAIQGKPVRLKGGAKAYILKDLTELGLAACYPLLGGYVCLEGYDSENGEFLEVFKAVRWDENGYCDPLEEDGADCKQVEFLSIAGMWDE